MKLQLGQPRITVDDAGLPTKPTKASYNYYIKTDDPNYAPVSLNDMYKFGMVLVNQFRKETDKTFTSRPHAGGRPNRKRKTVQPQYGSILAFPRALSSISKAIEKSREIMSRPQDPSDDLGPVFAEQTWCRAVDILTAHAKWVWKNTRIKVKPPVILDGPKGSIDIYWEPAPYGLLLNVPANPEEPATYYGDDAKNPDSNHTSGKIDPKKLVDPGVLAWLAYMGQK